MTNSFVFINDNNELQKLNMNVTSYQNNLNFSNNFLISGNINTEKLNVASSLNAGNTIITGNLNVLGNTTTIETINMVVNDNLISLNNGIVSNQNDSGILIERGSTGDNAFIGWDESVNKFIMGTTIATASTTGDLDITLGTLQSNLESDTINSNIINNYNANVLELNNDNQQYLIKDTNKNFTNGHFLGVDSNSKITPITQEVINTAVQNTIFGGTNITKSTTNYISGGGTINFNLDATLIGITSINSTHIEQELNNNNQQFLIKPSTVNFSSGDILGCDGSNKIGIITPTFILNSLTATLPLVKSINNISVSSTPTFNIIESGGDGFTIQNNGGTALVKIKSSSGGQPKLQYFQGTNLRAFQQYDGGSNKFDFAVELGSLHLKAYENKNGGTGRITLDDGIVKLQAGDTNNSAQDILTCSLTTVDIYKTLDINNNILTFKADDDYQYIRYFGSGMDGLEYHGYGEGTGAAHRFKAGPSGTAVLELHADKIDFNKTLYMNQNTIYMTNNGYHYIKFNGSGMDGIELGGYGSTGGVPFLRATCSNGNTPILECFKEKVIIHKSLHMNANLISFQPNNESHFIQYSGVNMNGVEVAGFGSGLTPVFRVKRSSGGNPYILECERSKVILYKPLVFRFDNSDTSTTTNITIESNGLLSVNIVESGEFRINNSSTNHNYFKTIAQGTGANGRTFFFEQGGDSGSSNGGAFQTQCSRGKMLFQSDRNLVVYNTDGSVAFSANDSKNAHSSRDYKTNVNDLVEDESVNIIKNINPVSYEYKKEYYDDLDKCSNCNCNVRKGFIWEDIKHILPQSAKSVNMNNPDYPMTKLLDLREIIPDLVKTVQYLLNKVEAQADLISNLQSQIS